jgi:hypothetical protein
MSSSHSPQRIAVAFDDGHAVANAGLLLPATLAERLGVQQLADELLDLGGRAGAAHPGSKVLTLVHTLVAGGDCIDDADLLRAGSTGAVLGHQVLAPSTLGTSYAASPSATFASWTGWPNESCPGPGRQEQDQAMGR